MTRSSLTDVVALSPNHYAGRTGGVNKVTIHHTAFVGSAEQIGAVFASPARQASSNYGIGNDGRIGLYVDEDDGPWTSSSYWNDNQAITIETSNSATGGEWPVSGAAFDSLIRLCADICTRYGIEPYYDGTTGATFTEHRMYAPTGCPGEYLDARMQLIVKEVRKLMNGTGGKWVKSERTGRWWYERTDGSWPADEWEKIDGKWYFFDGDGYMHEGWLWWAGDWWYLRPEKGDMAHGCWLKLDGKRYFMNDDGRMATGFKQGKTGAWYCFDETGALVTDDKRIVVNGKGKITIK